MKTKHAYKTRRLLADRLAALRQRHDVRSQPLQSAPADIPLIDAVIAARGKLSGHAYGKLQAYVIDRPHYIQENPNRANQDSWHDLYRRADHFNTRFPTLRAFQEGLRRDDPEIRHMHMVGPKILSEFRRVFLDEH